MELECSIMTFKFHFHFRFFNFQLKEVLDILEIKVTLGEQFTKRIYNHSNTNSHQKEHCCVFNAVGLNSSQFLPCIFINPGYMLTGEILQRLGSAILHANQI